MYISRSAMLSIACCCFSTRRRSARICSDSLLPNMLLPRLDRRADNIEVVLLCPLRPLDRKGPAPLLLGDGGHLVPAPCIGDRPDVRVVPPVPPHMGRPKPPRHGLPCDIRPRIPVVRSDVPGRGLVAGRKVPRPPPLHRARVDGEIPQADPLRRDRPLPRLWL